ncbi:MAG: TldD/PmbA family protein [Bacteroidota bacterium]
MCRAQVVVGAAEGIAAFEASRQRLEVVFPEVLASLQQDGAHYADGFYERSLLQYGRWVQHAHGRLSPAVVHIRSALVEGLALHAHRREGHWFGATSDATPDAAYRLAGRLPLTEEPAVAVPVPTVPVPTAAPEAPLRALLERTADLAFSLSDQIASLRIDVQSRLRQTLVVNTDGVAVLSTQPLTELRVEVDVRGAHGRTAGTAQRAVVGLAEAFDEDVPARIARDAVAQAQRLRDARPLTAGSYPIVLAAGWGGAWLHEVVGHHLEADVALAHTTAMSTNPIAPTYITLLDDGTHPDGRASASHDDEGTATGETTLIREGQCLQWLTDRTHADRLAMLPTGNGRRASYAHPPLPRMTNLYLAPGTDRPDALVHTVRDGLLVHELGRGVVDMATQTYRMHVREGSRIEQGRRTHAVRDVWLEGPIDGALFSIRGVANDGFLDRHRGRCVKHGQQVPISCGTPTLLLSTLRVSPS